MSKKIQDTGLNSYTDELLGFGLVNGKPQPDLQVARPVYKQDELNQASNYEKPNSNIRNAIHSKLSTISFCSICSNILPVLEWLPKYNWTRDLLSDIISGITVAIMHIPQGIAYGMLGNVHPVVGIYMAFFPVIIYFFFGTSRHISIGTFAIVCLMTGQVVSSYSKPELAPGNHTLETTTSVSDSDTYQYTPIEVAVTVTFMVAIFELLMYFLRLGVLANLLSETLVNGFTCAAAFHVISSQLKDLFGLNIKKKRGHFSVLYTAYDAVLAIPQANKMAVSISMVAIVIMVINNEIFKPWLAKKTRVPFPIELLAVLSGTVACYFLDLHEKYNVTIVGDIPTGLPAPALPMFSLMPTIAVDCFVIAIVSYTITISMALIFAQKAHYEVRPNQELLALGCSNLFGSFFSTMPVTASLARSLIQFNVGGVTQIASIISCSLLLIVLLWIGPLFEKLPRCILASIIVVALKGMLMQATMLKKFWKLSKWDALVWIVTFLTTVIVSIDIGLVSGVIVSLLSIFIQGYRPYTCLLGVVPNTDLYLDSKRYKGVQEIDGIKIFHYGGALNFASKGMFKDHLVKKIGFDPTEILTKRTEKDGRHHENEELLVKCIILDFSAITYVDPAGVQLLNSMAADFKELRVALYIANCSGPIFETFAKCDKFEGKASKINIYPTIHDAVLYAKLNEF